MIPRDKKAAVAPPASMALVGGRGTTQTGVMATAVAPALILVGLLAWGYGVSKITPSNVGELGLLLGTNVWFPVGMAMLLAAYLLELASGSPRGWLLGLNLVALIVAVYAAVPLIFKAPEYAWVYKHLGIISSFQSYGRVTDPTNIYDQWPTLFAGVALVASLAHVNAIVFAEWAPLAFELANVLLFLGILRTLIADRRTVWLAALLFEGFVAWVGQDYLSPQAFGFLLWLGVILAVLRLMRWHPVQGWNRPRSWVVRWSLRMRDRLTDGAPAPHAASRRTRAFAIVIVALVYGGITTAHQLSPYMAIASIAGLTVLDLVRPRWLVLGMVVVAGGFLALHYQLVAQEYGGLFGGDPITNASVRSLQNPSRAQFLASRLVDLVAAMMWLLSVGAVLFNWRRPGRIVIPAILAFAPFVVLLASNYGGEAVYRVFLFSAPWCAVLIADTLGRFPSLSRSLGIIAVSGVAVAASLQSLYASAPANAFTPYELSASHWLYTNVPRGGLIVLPSNNFPTLETADYGAFDLQVMPADPLSGASWMDEADLKEVSLWLHGLGHRVGYVVVSRSMTEWRKYYGVTPGFDRVVRALEQGRWNARLVYRNPTTTIYRIDALTSAP